MDYQNIALEIQGRVAIVTLARPKQLNALNDSLMDELGLALQTIDQDSSVSVLVITGSERAFAAGADIAPMKDLSYQAAYQTNYITRNWEQLGRLRKPVIAAVAGYALGGGCELVMMCDIVVAAESAVFGQPEIRLGIIPGAGGTQRLTRAVGKAKAMDLILSARTIDASEAERIGLISRVVPAARLREEAILLAAEIAKYPLQALMASKEAINRSFETSLSEGILFERRSFHALFGTADQKEGMAAFLEKREPTFKNC